MTLDATLELSLPKFVPEVPDDQNAFRLRAGTWKFKFEDMDASELDNFLRTVDGRPRLCSEFFPGYRDFSIVEFGPSDGYNTAQLELYGATDIVSIEANADAFLRCLIMKNARGMKTKFLLGDFLKFMSQSDSAFDLAYASGVLYHLQDPVDFLLQCGRRARHLFVWSLYFDEDAVRSDAYEMRRFGVRETVSRGGEQFVYHQRSVDPQMVTAGNYQGGIEQHANWLTLPDLKRAIELAGFRITRTIADNVGKMPAMNFWASKPEQPFAP
jgi:SAM-dependent methyltransferase